MLIFFYLQKKRGATGREAVADASMSDKEPFSEVRALRATRSGRSGLARGRASRTMCRRLHEGSPQKKTLMKLWLIARKEGAAPGDAPSKKDDASRQKNGCLLTECPVVE